MSATPNRPVPYVSASFAAVLVCFFLTFANVSCQGRRVATFSGREMAFGTEVHQQSLFGSDEVKKVPGESLALAALGAAVAGLLLSVGRRATRTLTAIAGAAGALLLLLLHNKVDQDVLRSGGGMLTLDFAPPYYLAVAMFVAGAVLSVRNAPKTDGS
jgi:hypothetical protein